MVVTYYTEQHLPSGKAVTIFQVFPIRLSASTLLIPKRLSSLSQPIERELPSRFLLIIIHYNSIFRYFALMKGS